jgi:tRNA G18 (ribose-2'-O)-methylase SpoU
MRTDEYQIVSDGELLRSRGLFVAEGRLVLRRVIEDSRYRLHSILLNEAAQRDLAGVLERVPSDVPVFVRDAKEIEAIAGYHVHRGCLALVNRPPPRPFDDLIAHAGPILVLDGVADADNVGGVFRNAAAFGAGGVLISPTTCDPLYRKAVRTSMAAVLRVPFVRAATWPGDLARVRSEGFTLVALSPAESSMALDLFVADRLRSSKIALIVGTEGSGLSVAVENMADVRVRIPMSGAVDSLNVAVASGIALYAIARSSSPGAAAG